MKTLAPLSSIHVPPPQPPREYTARLLDQTYSFNGLKTLLGAADFSKAGDRNAGLAAKTESTREAARTILASLTLQHLYDNPLTADDGRVDSVMRVNYDINRAAFDEMSGWTLSQLKDQIGR